MGRAQSDSKILGFSASCFKAANQHPKQLKIERFTVSKKVLNFADFFTKNPLTKGFGFDNINRLSRETEMFFCDKMQSKLYVYIM